MLLKEKSQEDDQSKMGAAEQREIHRNCVNTVKIWHRIQNIGSQGPLRIFLGVLCHLFSLLTYFLALCSASGISPLASLAWLPSSFTHPRTHWNRDGMIATLLQFAYSEQHFDLQQLFYNKEKVKSIIVSFSNLFFHACKSLDRRRNHFYLSIMFSKFAGDQRRMVFGS